MDPHRTLCSCKKVMSHLDPSVAYLEEFIDSLDRIDVAVVTRTSGMSVVRAGDLINDFEVSLSRAESQSPFRPEVLKGLVRSAQRLLTRFVGKFYVAKVDVLGDHASILIDTPSNTTLEVQIGLDFKSDYHTPYAKVVHKSYARTATRTSSYGLNGTESERAFDEVISYINEFLSNPS